jgi:hypothetical protein
MSAANLYMFQSNKSAGLFCFSRSAKGTGLPVSLAPWMGYGVLRLDQKPPHGMSRQAIEAGINAVGYQLWRHKKKPETNAASN